MEPRLGAHLPDHPREVPRACVPRHQGSITDAWLASLTAKRFRADESAIHKHLYRWRGGQQTGVSVLISRGQAHRVYGDDLVMCLKKELRLSTMRDARHFIE